MWGPSDSAWGIGHHADFIRFFYDTASAPFLEIMRKIEAGEPPYEPPSVDDGEPPFQEDYWNAETGLDTVGQACLSLLSRALWHYFDFTSKRGVFHYELEAHERELMRRRGFLTGYKAALGEIYGTDWSDCPVNFDIIEQVVLARNRSQHGGGLLDLRIEHDPDTLKRFPTPHFARREEVLASREWTNVHGGHFAPAVRVSREALFEAVAEVEKLSDWLDDNLDRAMEWLADPLDGQLG